MKLPDKKYSVIYADPPWSYRQHGTGPKSRGNAAQHYHTMTTEDICALPMGCLGRRDNRVNLAKSRPRGGFFLYEHGAGPARFKSGDAKRKIKESGEIKWKLKL